MSEQEWQEVVDYSASYIVKISTPSGTGTGFLFSHTDDPNLCAIATAGHVVRHAHYWEEPIRIYHPVSGHECLTRRDGRAILLDERVDTAALIFNPGEINFPDDLPILAPEGQSLRVGIEIGWMGFPVVASDHLCFFSGRISAFSRDESTYLVDGVSINGVSGGPAIHRSNDGKTHFIGVVSAYIPNLATGEALPGLSIVRDVVQLQEVVKQFGSIEEAHESESPTEEREDKLADRLTDGQ